MNHSPEGLLGISNREVWQILTQHPDFKKLKSLYSVLLGDPIWCLVGCRFAGGSVRHYLDPSTFKVWPDDRLTASVLRDALGNAARSQLKSHHEFGMLSPRGAGSVFFVPLLTHRFHEYALVIIDKQSLEINKAVLHLLASAAKHLVQLVSCQLENKKLTNSLRPRMVALSTIHTMHRLLNAYTDLDDLFKKIATLTAQVLKAEYCVVMMADHSGSRRVLMERGRSGGGPQRDKSRRRILTPGYGIEGKVFQTAKHFMNRQVLCIPMIDQDVVGVICVKNKRGGRGFDFFDKEILMTLAEEAVVAAKNAELYEEQKQVALETIQSLAAILGARFSPSKKVSSRVLLSIATQFSIHLKMTEEEATALHYATLLKDASKIGLPDDILKKRAKLTGKDYQILRQHPVQGAKMLQSFRRLKPVAPIILHSHENYDGSGYPHGLKGEAIPIGARILSVINAFAALIGGRPYRRGISIAEALSELKHSSGTQFDPKIVELFHKVVLTPAVNEALRRDVEAGERLGPAVVSASGASGGVPANRMRHYSNGR